MEYNISISVDNAAFGEEPETEVARILRGLAESLVTSGIPGELPSRKLYDINGNICGYTKTEMR